MNSAKNQSGYTLIELLLYIALVGILLSAVTAFFGMSTDARIKNQSISEVNDQGIYVMDYITQTVRNATAISSPAAGTTSTQLTVTVPTASFSPTIFSVSGGVLQVKEGTGAAVSLTNSKVHATSLNITNVTRSGTSGIVRISVTLSRVNTANRNEYDYTKTFTTSAGLRQ